MIDYVYTKIHNLTTDELFNNERLSFDGVVSLKTGELAPNTYRKRRNSIKRNDAVAEYKSLVFSIVNNKHLHFDGSLHQYAHNGKNNNDFVISELKQVYSELKLLFGIEPENTTIHNLEFAVNIELPFSVAFFLDSIVSFKGKAGNRQDFNGKGDILQFKFTQFELKLYDKGRQQGGGKNLLRFEIKIRKMDFLHSKKIPVYTLTDLLNSAILVRLGNILLAFARHLLISDPQIKNENFSTFEIDLIKDGNNPRYWSNLKKTNNENYKKRMYRFNKLMSDFGCNKIKLSLLELLKVKWNFLTQNDYE